jgi:hypothetical protein
MIQINASNGLTRMFMFKMYIKHFHTYLIPRSVDFSQFPDQTKPINMAASDLEEMGMLFNPTFPSIQVNWQMRPTNSYDIKKPGKE